MEYGYGGKILRVDLSKGSISVDEPDDIFYRRYFGGSGFIGYFLLKELASGVDPLGPDNKLVFAGGPITGVPIAGSGRNSVGAKSPLTGGFGQGEVGGFWGLSSGTRAMMPLLSRVRLRPRCTSGLRMRRQR
jgi:aldehyde:ferredoxin oxidoreductase